MPIRFTHCLAGVLAFGTLIWVLCKTSCIPHFFSSSNSNSFWDFVDLQTAVRYSLGGEPLETWQLDTSRDYMCRFNGSEEPQVRSFVFEIQEVETMIGSTRQTQTLVNGQYPGPLIEANLGDTISITVINSGREPTSLHIHGFHMQNMNYYDGVPGVTQCEIQPGKYFTYEFVAQDVGTYWYHSHSGMQTLKGISGPVVVHARKDEPQVDHDMVVFISDIYKQSVDELVDQFNEPVVGGVEPVPVQALLQGKIAPKFVFKAGKLYRIRLINASSYLSYTIAVDNHLMEVIEADGNPVNSANLAYIPIACGQRYSVLLKPLSGKTGKIHRINAVPHVDEMEWQSWAEEDVTRAATGSIVYSPRGYFTGPLLQDRYSPMLPKSKQALVELFDVQNLRSSNFDDIPGPADRTLIFDVRMEEVDGVLTGTLNHTALKLSEEGEPAIAKHFIKPDTNTKWHHNHRRPTIIIDKPAQLPNSNEWLLKESEILDVVIRNLDDGAHPFHLHGHSFWIMERGKIGENGKDSPTVSATTVKRDVVYIAQGSYARIRFVANNPGYWLFHCHNMWHSMTGMAAMLIVEPGLITKYQAPPAEWFALCSN